MEIVAILAAYLLIGILVARAVFEDIKGNAATSRRVFGVVVAVAFWPLLAIPSYRTWYFGKIKKPDWDLK